MAADVCIFVDGEGVFSEELAKPVKDGIVIDVVPVLGAG